MHHIVAMLRLMTHINIGATIALVAWLTVTAYSSSVPKAPERADARPAVAASTGAVR